MGITIFVVCNDSFVFQGIEFLIKEHSIHNVKIVKCALIDLMSVESNCGSVIIYASEEHIRIMDAFIKLDKHVVVSDKISDVLLLKIIKNLERKRVTPNNGVHWKVQSILTARERRYCYYVYKGMTNEQVSRWLQCSTADVSYLKKKVMKKWNCRNRVQLYHVISALFGGVYH